MLANHDIRVAGNIECTQVNHALIDENIGRFGLDACAEYYNCPAKKGDRLYAHLAEMFGGEPNRDQMSNFWRLSGDDPLAHEYAVGDGRTTWMVHEKQQEVLDEEDLRLVWSVECRVIRTLFRMERRGVPVDEERLSQFESFLDQKLREARTALPEGFNVRSQPQIKKLMEDNGHTDWPLTAKGNPSFTEHWLKTFDLGQRIIKVRKIENLFNSFINPLKERHLHNGRIHCNFNQVKQDDFGTVSGRLSSNAPNMQQVPKRDKELAPLFRTIFVADPGYKWSANDYKQQEYVVFAEYSGSKKLQDGYRQEPPLDMHSMVAQLLGVERDPTAKRLNLGQLYGMGVDKLAWSLNISTSMAKNYRAAYDREVPEARNFLKNAEKRARGRGYVFTKLKRRCRLDRQIAHKAGNRIIQGTSADITKLKMVEIDEYFKSQGDICHILLQVHDELDWQFPNTDEGWRQDAEARRIMKSFDEGDLIHMKTPLQVDNDIAEDWGRASFPDQFKEAT
jgi:DNA polymerase-1